MIKFVESNEEIELLHNFCGDSFGISIAALSQAYSPSENLCRFWLQLTDGCVTAALCNLCGEVVLSAADEADFEEINEFVEIIGYTSILCRESAAASLNLPIAEKGGVFCKDAQEACFADYCVPQTTADYREIFDLLGMGGDFDGWFADVARRINKGTAQMHFIRRNGKIVSTASLLHIFADKAILGAVATDNAYRHCGLASSLVNSFGNKKIYLRCLPQLSSFYERFGYKQVDNWAEIK